MKGVHELSIAVNLVEIATEQIERLALGPVEAVHLRLGRLSGVVPDALLFSFDVATQGSALEGARLVIQTMPIVVRCPRCDAERELPGDEAALSDLRHSDAAGPARSRHRAVRAGGTYRCARRVIAD